MLVSVLHRIEKMRCGEIVSSPLRMEPARPKPLRWMKSADAIFASVKRFCLRAREAEPETTPLLRTSDAGYYRDHGLREVFNGLRYVVRNSVGCCAMSPNLPPSHSAYD